VTGQNLARPTTQFQAKDATFWGALALVVWAVAILSADVSAAIPDRWLSGLHSSRLDSGNFSQLRGEVADLTGQAAQLKQDNAVLLQRLRVSEQTDDTIARRVGALEVTMPKLLDAVNNPDGTGDIDRNAVTASTGTTAAPVTSFDTDGGSVSYTTTPLEGRDASSRQAPDQPMPQALTTAPQSDSSAFGIALGPPIAEEAGPTAWDNMNDRVGTLLIGLAPLLGPVEGGSAKRLVAGPLASEADARELCGRMAKVGIACASVPFVGEPLAAQ
jgi:hypothetical protein